MYTPHRKFNNDLNTHTHTHSLSLSLTHTHTHTYTHTESQFGEERTRTGYTPREANAPAFAA